MKKIEAVIKPFKLDGIQNAIKKIGIKGVLCTEVNDFSWERGSAEIYRETEFSAPFSKRCKIEFIVEDGKVEECIQIIVELGSTENTNDGRISISPVDRVIPITKRRASPIGAIVGI